MKRALCLITLLLSLSISAFSQTVPQNMNFQGRLAKPDGTPVGDGTYAVTFRIYNTAASGTLLWSQTTSNVATRNGSFAVRLDLTQGYPMGQSFGTLLTSTPFLEIQVGSDAALTPRQPFTSVFSSLVAGTALTVPDGSLTAAKFIGGVLAPVGPAGGDLKGTYPNPQIKTDPGLLYKVSGTLMSVTGAGVAVDASQINAPLVVSNSGWQSFTASNTGNLVEIDIVIGTSGGQVPTTLRVYNGVGTTGTPLVTQAITVATGAPTMQVFTLSLPVTANSQYTWAVGEDNRLRLGYAVGNPYTGGMSDLAATLDYGFQTWLNTGTATQIKVATDMSISGNTSVGGTLGVAGRVGIGTSTPATTLEIFKSAAGSLGPVLRLTNGLGGTGAQSALDLATYPPLSGTPASRIVSTDSGSFSCDLDILIKQPGADANPLQSRMHFSSGGNVGVGTTTPTSAFDVTGTIRGTNTNGTGVYGNGVNGLYGISTVNGGNGIVGEADTGSSAYGVWGISSTGYAGYFSGNVSVTGNVGIGTNTPAATLDVNGAIRGNGGSGNSTGVYGQSAGGNGVEGFSTSNTGVYGHSPSGGGVYGLSSSYIGVLGQSQSSFGVEGLSNSSVGVNGFSGSGYGVQAYSGTGDAINAFTYGSGNGIYASSQNGYGIRAYGGNIGLYAQNLSNPAINVYLATPVLAADFYGNINVRGNIAYTGTITHSSDVRYKKHIETLGNALGSLFALRGVTYEYRQDEFARMNFPKGQQFGFIAQEVEKVFPDLVSTDEKGYKSVNYIGVIPVLVESVKTLNTQIETMQAENLAQAQEITDLKKQNVRISALEKQLASVLELLKNQNELR